MFDGHNPYEDVECFHPRCNVCDVFELFLFLLLVFFSHLRLFQVLGEELVYLHVLVVPDLLG